MLYRVTFPRRRRIKIYAFVVKIPLAASFRTPAITPYHCPHRHAAEVTTHLLCGRLQVIAQEGVVTVTIGAQILALFKR